MIIVKLQGGLGNQLFQYAMGRDLSIKKNTSLKIDAISGFKNDPYGRTYSLDQFNISAELASAEEVARINTRGAARYITRIVDLTMPYYRRQVLIEDEKRQFTYDKNVLGARDPAYVIGYWQNERYFLDVADVIRKEFTLRSVPDPVNQKTAREMADQNAVCVHVRRLHGISNDKRTVIADAAKLHGACSLEYYATAVKAIAGSVKDPHFFIFSDDCAWARENLRIGYPVTCVTHNDAASAHKDLWLMTRCKHYIIANSSLSWWGAWLSGNLGKIVYAPKRWDTLDKPCIEDITPPSWHRI